ncbi:hypothetical protein BGS_1305 [Beggiatoa sp. SS]|nr:hypothetical protein BGS_1305 [Beggiatoa sp. SS]
MLPLDNKFRISNYGRNAGGQQGEKTAGVLGELGRYIAPVPEVSDYQV